MAGSSSAAAFLAMREEDQNQIKQQYSLGASSAAAQAKPPAAPKKKRNQPCSPYPDAEVIALSPNTLMATNRFVCEVCNKGFQREQNLQLHRRGHNLPWKLKQRPSREAKRKVYLCPEPSCAHHDPSRALGDLTGIKKHYSRKHGEKKFKCQKCNKKYAVQSDWKAHSKTCGTKEYRCDCGTLFARRDSFITHRAFCDGLAQESARNPQQQSTNIGSTTSLGRLSQLGSQISAGHDHPPPPPPSAEVLHLGASCNRQFDGFCPSSLYQQDNQLFSNTPNSSISSANLFSLGFFPTTAENQNMSASTLLISNQFNFAGNTAGGGLTPISSSLFSSSYYSSSFQTKCPSSENSTPMSATALLQKAALIGSTSSSGAGGCAASLLRGFAVGGSSTENTLFAPSFGGLFGGGENNTNHDNYMNSSLSGGGSNIFGGGVGGYFLEGAEQKQGLGFGNMQQAAGGGSGEDMDGGVSGGSDGLTRDFLGVGEIVRGVGGCFGQTQTSQPF